MHLLEYEQLSVSLLLVVLSFDGILLLPLMNLVYTALLFSISCNLLSPAAGIESESQRKGPGALNTVILTHQSRLYCIYFGVLCYFPLFSMINGSCGALISC